MTAAILRFPLPAPRGDKAKRGYLKRGESWPENVCPIRRPKRHEPQPVPMTVERAALRAIFDALKPKQQRAVLGSLWRAHLAGGDDDWLKFYVARAMLRGEKV